MIDFYIVFVEPESEDNIGALARVMANFDFKNLILVNPKVNPYGDKVKIVAREKGWEIIKNMKIYNSLDEVIDLFDINYGTTGVSSKMGNEVLRNPLTPREFANSIYKYDGKIGIFFGRESKGFSNEELNKFDGIITIPASEEYPIMNITHSAAIILYELFISKNNPIRKVFKLINNQERKYLYKMFKDFVDVLPSQDYRKPFIYRGLRNLIGKALITKREYSLLMGMLRIAKENIENCRKNKNQTL
ncbi:rRNA methylase [Candidatus Nanobsidianus stetteri]|jgi:TrmH family RNA methyltransferase|uniref:RNA methyltransferase n=1 Tax=Nanobsidianus stetteri TaxID=1294122 RepID=R1GA91_NANST|nr:rRNA methylase [Candidatus Nanobsidianus stetteri]PVU71642.1 RNA methyltransferase [Candidatus Nanobsidianus stetteri]